MTTTDIAIDLRSARLKVVDRLTQQILAPFSGLGAVPSARAQRVIDNITRKGFLRDRFRPAWAHGTLIAR